MRLNDIVRPHALTVDDILDRRTYWAKQAQEYRELRNSDQVRHCEELVRQCDERLALLRLAGEP